MKLILLAALLAGRVASLPQGSPSPSSSPPSQSGSPTSAASSSGGAGSGDGGSFSVPDGVSTVATSISTAIPSPTVAVSSPLFSAAPPQQQPWCAGRPGSRIYCPGEILQAVQLQELYADSKTFVDKPTTASEDEVVAAFANVTSANTIEALVNWIDTYFAGEGLDVLPADIPNFNEDPGFLNYVQDPYIKGWVKQVHGYWRDLVRVNVVNESCPDCVSSQIPLNRSFVVPGGRFRENYYWDSFFILEGLLTSGLQDLANNTINNYLDLIEDIGFIPNGGRIYYLNRSQPPLFTQMLYLYIKSTNDTSFLERAVRLNDQELQWWDRNNSITVKGPSGQSHFTHSYTVNNSAPRPESYAEDWQTVNGPIGGPYVNLSRDLYSDLASGAESGYDYSAGRWFTEPLANSDDTTAGLRTIDINEIIPVDLESILYRDYLQIAELHEMTGNSSRASYWRDRAQKSRAAILDLHWDSEALAFREFNLTSGALVPRWSIAGYYPYWSGVWPDEVVQSASSAQKAFGGLAYLTAHYNGSIPITLYESGQQWDWPNVWPPTMYITVKALENIPRNVSQTISFANYSTSAIDFAYLPSNHFGLEQGQLPGQPVLGQDTNITSVSSFNELGNLGNSSALGWGDGLATALVQRYMSSAYCSWYSTGGSIPGLLEQLSQEDLNATNSVGNTGNMFEKFSAYDIDAAGAGGEYQVQAGFGWTNGVAIWFARNYGSAIQAPACPAIELEVADSAMSIAHRNMALRPNLVHN